MGFRQAGSGRWRRLPERRLTVPASGDATDPPRLSADKESKARCYAAPLPADRHAATPFAYSPQTGMLVAPWPHGTITLANEQCLVAVLDQIAAFSLRVPVWLWPTGDRALRLFGRARSPIDPDQCQTSHSARASAAVLGKGGSDMDRLAVGSLAAIVFGMAGVLVNSQANAQSTQQTHLDKPQVEEIYIGRSVREAHATNPTAYCDQTNTNMSATSEDRFTFRSTATRASDGRVVDTNIQVIGNLHACFGPTADPAISNFYAEGNFGSIAFKGIGECRVVKPNFPEPGLFPLRCFLDLSGLPAEYVAGELTTNSVLSREVLGTETDPPGYTQASIATIRLWKVRK